MRQNAQKEDNNSGTVNIFSINDTHGAVVTNSNVTGLDKVETIVNELETEGVKNLFTIGDGAGVTRGLIQASASGVYVARTICARG